MRAREIKDVPGRDERNERHVYLGGEGLTKRREGGAHIRTGE